MNELLAIILIVLLCCFLFFAWLFALATCPDRMVNLISGTKQSSSPVSRASEDLLGADDKKDFTNENENNKTNNSKQGSNSSQTQNRRPNAVINSLLVRSRSIPTNRSNGFIASKLNAEMRSNSKKLSVVPEADEQLTVTSISQCMRQNNPPRSPVSTSNQQSIRDSAIKVVLLDRNSSNEKNIQQSDIENKRGEQQQKQFDRHSEPPNIHIV
uniref:Uncharacterized protein n=1 Tax=Meloidogyne javanica TaxID=6303 RepID=A0A915MP44_MELJA